MPQSTITLPVDSKFAEEFATLPEGERIKAGMLLRIWHHQPKPRAEDLMKLMDKMSDEAKQNGLTQEILDEILEDV